MSKEFVRILLSDGGLLISCYAKVVMAIQSEAYLLEPKCSRN